jgi:putative endonuclease
MKEGFVYFMANKRNGTIYIGVMSNLSARVYG